MENFFDSHNKDMAWIIFVTILFAICITFGSIATYFGMKSHGQEKELNNLKQNAAFLPTEFGILRGER